MPGVSILQDDLNGAKGHQSPICSPSSISDLFPLRRKRSHSAREDVATRPASETSQKSLFRWVFVYIQLDDVHFQRNFLI